MLYQSGRSECRIVVKSVALRACAGFTLVEMMTVIALFAIMMALALPSFNAVIERYRVAGTVGALEASLAFAHAEAIRRGATVTLNPRTGCAATGFSCGWDIQVAGSGTTTVTLKTESPDAKIKVTAVPTSFSIDPFGWPTMGSFLVEPQSDSSGGANIVRLCVSKTGRMRRQAGSGAC